MQNKWMSREEFEKSGDDSYCYVADNKGYVYFARYQRGSYFAFESRDEVQIKAVMQIEKPEYPGEVG